MGCHEPSKLFAFIFIRLFLLLTSRSRPSTTRPKSQKLFVKIGLCLVFSPKPFAFVFSTWPALSFVFRASVRQNKNFRAPI